MDIRVLYFFTVVLLPNYHVLCYKEPTSGSNDEVLENHIRTTVTFCSVKGNKLKVRFNASCPMCHSQKVMLFECNTWNPVLERNLDRLDRETIFHGVPDGSYSIVVERGQYTSNLTGCCDVQNNEKMVQKSNIVIYLTIVGSCIFAVGLSLGLFVYHFRHITTSHGMRSFELTLLNNSEQPVTDNTGNSIEVTLEQTTQTWV